MNPLMHLITSVFLSLGLGWFYHLSLVDQVTWLVFASVFGVILDWDHILIALIVRRKRTLQVVRTFSLVNIYKFLSLKTDLKTQTDRNIKNPRLLVLVYFAVHGGNFLITYFLAPSLFSVYNMPIKTALVFHIIVDTIWFSISHPIIS